MMTFEELKEKYPIGPKINCTDVIDGYYWNGEWWDAYTNTISGMLSLYLNEN